MKRWVVTSCLTAALTGLSVPGALAQGGGARRMKMLPSRICATRLRAWIIPLLVSVAPAAAQDFRGRRSPATSFRSGGRLVAAIFCFEEDPR